MDELVKQVALKTGLSEEHARTAVITVLGFLKDKLPAPVASQIDNVVGGVGGGEPGSDLATTLGGIFT